MKQAGLQNQKVMPAFVTELEGAPALFPVFEDLLKIAMGGTLDALQRQRLRMALDAFYDNPVLSEPETNAPLEGGIVAAAVGPPRPANWLYRYRYDRRGNTTEIIPVTSQASSATVTGRGLCMKYDAKGRMVLVQLTSGGGKTGDFRDCQGRRGDQYTPSSTYLPSTMVRYHYDHLNRRVQTEHPASGTTTDFTYDFDGQLLFEGPPGTSGTRTYYHHLDGQVVARSRGTSLSMVTEWYHNDPVGLPQLMTNSSNQVIWSALYDAYGRVADINEDVDGNGSYTYNRLRFPGQYADWETAISATVGQPFYYNWNRHYSPTDGRYLQADPLSSSVAGVRAAAGDVSLMQERISAYLYALGTPTRFTDETGESARLPYDDDVPPEDDDNECNPEWQRRCDWIGSEDHGYYKVCIYKCEGRAWPRRERRAPNTPCPDVVYR